MAQAIRVRNPRGELVEPQEVSASEAKNVGRILDYVAKDGGVTITRRRQPLAVVISVETYARLLNAEQGTLDTLAAEFDEAFDRMQQPGMAAAMERAFGMTPVQLGRAAVALARSEGPPSPRRQAATKKRSRGK